MRTASASSRAIPDPGRGLSRAAVGVCPLGLLLTSLLCGTVPKMEYDRAAEFTARAQVRVAAVTRAFADVADAARAVNLLFRASDEVSRAGFDGAALVDAIIPLAHGLRMGVVAEGGETIEQLDCLRGCGWDEVQGYVFCVPQPVERLEPLLRARRMEPATSPA